MYLIEIFLPLYDNEGRAFEREDFAVVRRTLAERFGGVTAFTQAPAEGLWQADGGEVSHDEMIIFEVMAPELEREWWAKYQEQLRHRFRQETLLVRATVTELL
jgi:hypothetical protein